MCVSRPANPTGNALTNREIQTLCDLAGQPSRIHKPQGAFFLWLWLPKLPIRSFELYERLKQNGVIVVPGEYFFPGIDSAWAHTHECIRISYAQDLDVLEQGIDIIAQEIHRVYSTKS